MMNLVQYLKTTINNKRGSVTLKHYSKQSKKISSNDEGIVIRASKAAERRAALAVWPVTVRGRRAAKLTMVCVSAVAASVQVPPWIPASTLREVYHQLVARYHQIVSRYHLLVSRYHQLVSRYHQQVDRYHQQVPRYLRCFLPSVGTKLQPKTLSIVRLSFYFIKTKPYIKRL